MVLRMCMCMWYVYGRGETRHVCPVVCGSTLSQIPTTSKPHTVAIFIQTFKQKCACLRGEVQHEEPGEVIGLDAKLPNEALPPHTVQMPLMVSCYMVRWVGPRVCGNPHAHEIRCTYTSNPSPTDHPGKHTHPERSAPPPGPAAPAPPPAAAQQRRRRPQRRWGRQRRSVLF